LFGRIALGTVNVLQFGKKSEIFAVR